MNTDNIKRDAKTRGPLFAALVVSPRIFSCYQAAAPIPSSASVDAGCASGGGTPLLSTQQRAPTAPLGVHKFLDHGACRKHPVCPPNCPERVKGDAYWLSKMHAQQKKLQREHQQQYAPTPLLQCETSSGYGSSTGTAFSSSSGSTPPLQCESSSGYGSSTGTAFSSETESHNEGDDYGSSAGTAFSYETESRAAYRDELHMALGICDNIHPIGCSLPPPRDEATQVAALADEVRAHMVQQQQQQQQLQLQLQQERRTQHRVRQVELLLQAQSRGLVAQAQVAAQSAVVQNGKIEEVGKVQRSLGSRLEALTRTTRALHSASKTTPPASPAGSVRTPQQKRNYSQYVRPTPSPIPTPNQQGSLKNKPILVVMPEWGKEELHSKRGQAESKLRAKHGTNVEEEIAKVRRDSGYVPGTANFFRSASALEWIMEAEHAQRILRVGVRSRSCVNQLFSRCFVNVDGNIELHSRGFIVD